MTEQRFPIRIGARSALALRILFGATPETSWAAVDEDTVSARFGRFSFSTPLTNVVRYRIEGPWAWITAIGVRMSVRHRDVSFAGSPRGGVRLDVREPVKWTLFHVPAFYVGTEDLEGFAAAIAAHGTPRRGRPNRLVARPQRAPSPPSHRGTSRSPRLCRSAASGTAASRRGASRSASPRRCSRSGPPR